MTSQADYINKLRADVTEAEKQLQALLEKREAYKSLITKLDAEERSLSKKLSETKAKFRELSGDAAPAPKPAQPTGVLQDVSQFEPLANALPSNVQFSKTEPPAATDACRTLAGPETEDVYTIGDIVAARTVSSYPLFPGGTKRQGSPICDQYYIQTQPDRMFICVADGCNWGERPREAARVAARGFVTYEQDHFGSTCDIRECGKILLSAMKAAHNGIIANKTDLWEAGTTTLVGGVIVPMDLSAEGADKQAGEYGVCLLSIGDCKCFLWDSNTGKVRDITVDNRGNLLDPTDPGGRLGPYGTSGLPDTRNLTLFFERCNKDDILMLCSDGVHDNLDPSSLGVDPEELSPKFAGMNWDEACKADYQHAAEIKRQFSAKRLADIINGQGAVFDTKFGNIKTEDVPSKGKDVVLGDVCRDITEYCLRVTKSSRDFMEHNVRDKLPKDYKLYPGKMDHTTCVLIRARIGPNTSPEVATVTVATPTQPATPTTPVVAQEQPQAVASASPSPAPAPSSPSAASPAPQPQ